MQDDSAVRLFQVSFQDSLKYHIILSFMASLAGNCAVSDAWFLKIG